MAKKLTPAMQQYQNLKEEHSDCVLFFRMGDFYEMFDDDAKLVARELGLTLTTRNKKSENPQPMAGIPHHASKKYIAELIGKGYRIAVAEQVSDPSLPGIVERKVERVVTPGTVVEDESLEAKEHSYIFTFTGTEQGYAVAFADVSTGACSMMNLSTLEEVAQEILRLRPREIVITHNMLEGAELQKLLQGERIPEPHSFEAPKSSKEVLLDHFGVDTLEAFELENEPLCIEAAGNLLFYIGSTQKNTLQHITGIHLKHKDGYMHVDSGTLRNLEIFGRSLDFGKEGSLLHVVDETMTSAGGRLLRTWLLHPLRTISEIQNRHEAVEQWFQKKSEREQVRAILRETYDIERILSRLVCERANPRDCMSLLVTIEKIQALLVVISSMKKGLGKEILQHLAFDDEVQKMYEQLSTSLADEPPLSLQEGGIFQDGFHKELDQLRELITGGKQWITEFQAKEQESTGIPNLKVQFNKVFGYYIEVTKSHTSKVPDHYERKQTLVNAERYTIPELKEYEHKVLTAEEKAFQLEYELFCELRRDILSKLSVLQKRAQGLAMLDVITTYAQVAHRGSYTRPEMSDKFSMSIENGRHPVVERMLTSEDESFVPNDVQFSEKGVHCAVITGPNMAGKSTYLRQNALILYMAQCGMFVPATAATLSVVDRIFTRVGAHDNLSKGQSTFMVEMQEAAFILRNATKNSFIILDEVGRGTSTYDGLSLAWAIFHYIHENIGAKTLFATHYHELISMIEALAHAKNYAVAVSDTKEGVLFLRKIIEGGISKSYGIEVAKRAGVPEDVLLHAEKTLLSLEKAPSNRGNGPEQLSFFAPVEIIEKEVIKSDPIIDKLKALHPESMSPLDALQWIIDHKPTD